jgi:hypothetical protein
VTEIAQKDLFTNRYRTIAPADPLELQIHISLVARLNLQCKKGIVFWHTPNGELREDRAGSKLKAMGLMPGVADLIFVFPNAAPLLFLEIKRHKGKPSPAQIYFARLMRGCGHHYEIVDSIDDAVACLQAYDVLPDNK